MQSIHALRVAVLGLLGFLLAKLATVALVSTLQLATQGQLEAVLFLIPYIASLYLALVALRATAVALRGA
jgi:hypothetical protein